MGLGSWLGRKAAKVAIPKVAEKFDTPEEAAVIVDAAMEGPVGDIGKWGQTLIAGFVGGGVTTLATTLSDPNAFTTPGLGQRALASFLVGGLVSIGMLLKQSPIPPKGSTIDPPTEKGKA